MASMNLSINAENILLNKKKTKYPLKLTLLDTKEQKLSIIKKGSKNQIATSYNELGTKINNKELPKAYITTNNIKQSTGISLKNSHISNNNDNNKSLSKILKYQIKKPVQQISFIKPIKERENSKIKKKITLSKAKVSPIIKFDTKLIMKEKTRALSKPNHILAFPKSSRAQISFVGLNQKSIKLDEIKENKSIKLDEIKENKNTKIEENKENKSSNKVLAKCSLSKIKLSNITNLKLPNKNKNISEHETKENSKKATNESSSIIIPEIPLETNEVLQKKKSLGNKTSTTIFKKVAVEKHQGENKRTTNVGSITTRNSLKQDPHIHKNLVSVSFKTNTTKSNINNSHLETERNDSSATSQNKSTIIKLTQRNIKKGKEQNKTIDLLSLIQENKNSLVKEKLGRNNVLNKIVGNKNKKDDKYSLSHILNSNNENDMKDKLFLEFDNFDDLNSVVRKINFAKVNLKQENIFSNENNNRTYKKFSENFEEQFNNFLNLESENTNDNTGSPLQKVSSVIKKS